jgi:hypothetical protein
MIRVTKEEYLNGEKQTERFLYCMQCHKIFQPTSGDKKDKFNNYLCPNDKLHALLWAENCGLELSLIKDEADTQPTTRLDCIEYIDHCFKEAIKWLDKIDFTQINKPVDPEPVISKSDCGKTQSPEPELVLSSEVYYCYVEGKNPPKQRHYTLPEAEKEADRLAASFENLGVKVHVLEVINTRIATSKIECVLVKPPLNARNAKKLTR